MSEEFQEDIAQTVRLCSSVVTPLEGDVSTENTVQDHLFRNIIQYRKKQITIHIHINVTVPSVIILFYLFYKFTPCILSIHYSLFLSICNFICEV